MAASPPAQGGRKRPIPLDVHAGRVFAAKFSAARGLFRAFANPGQLAPAPLGRYALRRHGTPSLTGVWRTARIPAAQSGTWAVQTAPPRRSRTPASSARRKPSRRNGRLAARLCASPPGRSARSSCRRPHGRAREAQPQAGRRSPRPASAHRFLRSVCNGLRRAIAGHANPAKYRFFASVEARLTACAPARPRRHRAQGRPLPVRSSSASATRRRDRCTRSIRRRLHF